MTERLSQTPWRRRRRLQASRTQALFTLVGLGLGLALPRITGGPQASASQVIDMLLTLGFGVLGVTGIIFSLLFLVVQWAHSNFSPRLTLFRNAPIVWRTFAVAVGVAVYSITAAMAVGKDSHVSVVVPAAAGVLLLALLGMLRTLQMQAFAAIQLAPVLHAVTEQGRGSIDALYHRAPGMARLPEAALPALVSTVTWPGDLAVLQQVDMERLVQAAQEGGAVIVLREVPGAVLTQGTPLADVHGAPLPSSAVVQGLVTGTERTLEQDPLMAVRLLADIVLRALSTAINDPATAVQGLDCVEELLSRLPDEPGSQLRVVDQGGEVRVVARLPDLGDFLRVGLDAVIAAAILSPTVLLRLHTLLTRLQQQGHTGEQEQISRRLAWVGREMATRFPLLWDESGLDAPDVDARPASNKINS